VEFSEGLTRLSAPRSFDFARDLLPQDVRGLLGEEKDVIDVGKLTEEELVKNVVENKGERRLGASESETGVITKSENTLGSGNT
jgi:hypothetical protein